MEDIKIYKAVDKLLDKTLVPVILTCVGIGMIFVRSELSITLGWLIIFVASTWAMFNIYDVRERISYPVAHIAIFDDGIQFGYAPFIYFSNIRRFEYIMDEKDRLCLKICGYTTKEKDNPCYEIQSLPITTSDLMFLLEKCKQRCDNPESEEEVVKEMEPVVKAINEATVGKGILRSFYAKMLLLAVICLAFYYGFQLYHWNDIKPLTDWSQYGRCYDKGINENDTSWAYHFAYGVFWAEDHTPRVKEKEETDSFLKTVGVSKKTMDGIMRQITREHLKEHGVNVKEPRSDYENKRRSFEKEVNGMDEEGLKTYADTLAKKKCLGKAEVDSIRQVAREEAVGARVDLERDVSIMRMINFNEERSTLLLYVALGASILLLVIHLTRNRSHVKRKRE